MHREQQTTGPAGRRRLLLDWFRAGMASLRSPSRILEWLWLSVPRDGEVRMTRALTYTSRQTDDHRPFRPMQNSRSLLMGRKDSHLFIGTTIAGTKGPQRRQRSGGLLLTSSDPKVSRSVFTIRSTWKLTDCCAALVGPKVQRRCGAEGKHRQMPSTGGMDRGGKRSVAGY